jgi:magnesium transporter
MITSFLYKKDKSVETDLSRARLFSALSEKDALLWVDMENPTEFESDALVEIFNFHPLAVEDCVADLSQPKVDDYDEYVFLVMHALTLKDAHLHTVELDVFLGPNYVITFHKEPIKSIDNIREYARRKPEGCLGRGADLLVYSILDQVVDQYMPVIEGYEDVIDQVEDQIFHNGDKNCLEEMVQLKRDVFHFRRTIAPQRDALNFLTRNEIPYIREENKIYFRDVYDHLFKIYGIVEGFHEAISGVLQAYFSYSSHTLNKTIQRMTVMATISMPPIMIASIYGMNFQHMPELSHPYGYLFSLILMAFLSIGMLAFMKWKKWI